MLLVHVSSCCECHVDARPPGNPGTGNVSLSASPNPFDPDHRSISSPYERVQSGNGVVRFKPRPVEAAPLPDDGVDDLWRG